MSEGLEKFIRSIDLEYEELLTDEQVSEILGFSKMYLCKLRKTENAIPFIRFGKLIKYFKADLINWIRFSKANSNALYKIKKT